MICDSADEVREHLQDVVFPQINKLFRLFKTQKMRQDEYLVINREWLLGADTCQVHSLDRDVNDRLYAAGVPTEIFQKSIDGKKLGVVKWNCLNQWRRDQLTQAQRVNGLCYVPGGPDFIAHQFNTYRDVSVQAAEGPDIDDFLDHLHDNICNGNTEYYQYLLDWLAHMVQKPGERPKTGIAVIGGQGTGKGIMIDFLKSMMGGDRNCNTTASNQDTKSFNFSLGNKIFVVFDEATFTGDRNQNDFMKKLVTEPRIRIEQKGVDAYEVDNFARVLITSNNMTSAVPAGIGARRWLIIECRNNLNADSLKALADRIGNNPGSPAAIPLYVNEFKRRLEERDISSFDPLKLPMQDTGFETKLINHYKEDSVYAFLCEWLGSENLTMFRQMEDWGRDGKGEYDDWLQWDEEVPFRTFYEVYKQCCEDAFQRPVGSSWVGKKLALYGIVVKTGTANSRYLAMPHPKNALWELDRAARFDQIVTLEQRKIITDYSMYRDLAHRRASQLKPTHVRPPDDHEQQLAHIYRISSALPEGGLPVQQSESIHRDHEHDHDAAKAWANSELKKMCDIAYPIEAAE